MSDVLTVEELAARLRIGRRQAYEAIRRGEIPGVIRIGRSLRISSHAVSAWLHDGAAEGGTTEAEPDGAAPTEQVGGAPWKAPPES